MRAIFLTLAVILSLAFSQQGKVTISGKVTDTDGNPIVGVNIYIPKKPIGTATNIDGKYSLTIPMGTNKLVISAVGYETKDTTITVFKDTHINFVLKKEAIKASPVIVTASRTKQKLLEAPISVSVESSDALKVHSVSSLEDAVRYLPGVSVTSHQISVRNVTGFAYGVGSRVIVMIDGVPVLSGDTGEIKWDALPISAVKQVELVKGAGSTMYGSGAVAGVLNIITQTPEKQDLTVTAKLGIYDKPYWKQWIWTEKALKFGTLSLTYSRKSGSIGYLASASYSASDGYRENDDFKRGKIFAKVESEILKSSRFSMFVDLAYEDRAGYFEWKSQSEALRTQPGRESDRVWSSKIYASASLSGHTKLLAGVYKLTLSNNFNNWESRIYNTVTGEHETESSRSNSTSLDFQLNKFFGEHYLSSGGTITYSAVDAITFGRHYGFGGAVFVADEFKRFHPLTLRGAFRFDAFMVDSATSGTFAGLSPQIAATYKISDRSFLRASLSSGFRIPTMAELFTSTSAGGILRVIPNPSLKPERGYTTEIGANYITKNFYGDIALFYNRFSDMIEPIPIAGTIVQFCNLRKTRVYGLEVNLKAKVKRLEVMANYLLSDARDVERDEKLPYRPKNTLKLGFQLMLLKNLILSADWRYKSKFEYGYYKADPKVETKVLDIEARYKLPRATVSFRVNNALNYNYVEIERNLAPIRHFILSLELKPLK